MQNWITSTLFGNTARIHTVPIVAGVYTATAAMGVVELGATPFDPAAYGPGGGAIVRSFRFIATLETSGAGDVATVQLVNLTDGAVIATLTTTSTTPSVVSAGLVPGNGAGQLPLAEKLYAVRLTASGGSVAALKSARIDVVYQ